MPHIAISMYPGRSDEIKKALAEKMQQALMEQLSVPKSVVSVSITDVRKEDWQENISGIPAEDMFIKPE